MKAAVVQKYGGPEVVSIRDMPVPEMRDTDVLVDLHAASLNPVDWKSREGKVKVLLPYKLPYIMGNDGAGVVNRVGAAAAGGFQPGDKVFLRAGKMRIGTYAESIALDSQFVAPMPKNISFEEAAGLPLVGLTALQAMIEKASVGPASRVLIHAGAGGVGTMAIQIAKILGAHVTTTASEKNFPLVKSLGADDVIDYRREDFTKRARDMDMVLDSIGGRTLFQSFQVVRAGGTVVSITMIPDTATAREFGVKPPLLWLFPLLNFKVNRAAAKAGANYRYLFMRADGEQLRRIGGWVDQGVLKPVVDRVFPLDQIREAFQYAEEGHARGKVILKIR